MLSITFLFTGEFVSTMSDEDVTWGFTGGQQTSFYNAIDDDDFSHWIALDDDQDSDSLTATFSERSLFSLTLTS